MSEEWIEKEFKNLSFGDKRLNARFVKTMTLLAKRPEDCINRAVDDWASKKAAYRLFSNSNCSHIEILKCHTQQTKDRMKGHKVVLSIHDSTYFSFNSKKSIKDLGCIGGYSKLTKTEKVDSHGFIGHYALAVSEEGLPLGLQGVKYWSRKKELPWDKESERWGELCDEVEELYDEDTQMIYIADREADMFELYYQTKVDQTDFVIRAKTDRLIHGKNSYLKWDLEKSKSIKDITLYCPKRKVEVEAGLKFGQVGFNDPKVNRAKHLDRRDIRSVKLNVVEVREKDNRNKDALRWILFTSLDVKNVEDALKVVNYYRQRWHIENYFKVLKGGCCKVENCNLKSYEKLLRYICAFNVLSWRLYWCRHLNDVASDKPAKLILSPVELKVIELRINKRNKRPGIKKVTPPVITVRDAIRYVAGLGGFNGRKGDGEPGIISIWRGFMRLQDKAEVLEELLETDLLTIK